MSPSKWGRGIPVDAAEDDNAIRRWTMLAEVDRVRLLIAVARHPALRAPELTDLLGWSREAVAQHAQVLLAGGFLRLARRGRVYLTPPSYRATERAHHLLRALLDPSDGKHGHQPPTSNRQLRLDVLRVLSTTDDEGLTTKQVSVALGVNWETARRAVKAMVDGGLVVEAKHPPTGSHHKWASTYTLTDDGRSALAGATAHSPPSVT